METKNRTNGMVDALNQATLNDVREKINSLTSKGYRVPELPEVTDTNDANILALLKRAVGKKEVYSIPKDLSKTKNKHLRRLAYRFLMNPTWVNANVYLHFLYKKVLSLEPAPKVRQSEKEEKIIAARRAWKKSQAETERLRVAYRSEKGDFYKSKLAS